MTVDAITEIRLAAPIIIKTTIGILITLIVLGWLYFADNIGVFGMSIWWLYAILMILSAGLKFHEMFEKKKNKLFPLNYSWQNNIGITPEQREVHIIFKNGEQNWCVDPNSINWNIEENNPIVKFRVLNKPI